MSVGAHLGTKATVLASDFKVLVRSTINAVVRQTLTSDRVPVVIAGLYDWRSL